MVPEVKVKIGADIAEFQSKMAAVQRRLAIFTAAAAAAVAGLGLAVKKQIDIADDLSKMSQRIGLPVEMLSRLSYAADLSGVSLEELATGVRFLSRTMVDMPDKLKELGIATRDAGGNMRSTEDVLNDLADVFASMPDGAQKTAIALDILGRSGTQMIPLLNGGSQALREMMEEARVLGVQIDTRTAKAAEAFNDNLTRLGYLASGVTRQLAAALAPTLEQVTNALVDFVKEYKPVEKFEGVINKVGDAWYSLIDGFVIMNSIARDVFRRLASSFEGLKFTVAAVATFLELKMKEAFNSIVTVAINRVKDLATLLNTLVGKIPGFTEAIDVDSIGAGITSNLDEELETLNILLRNSSDEARRNFDEAFRDWDWNDYIPQIRARDLLAPPPAGGDTPPPSNGGLTDDGAGGDDLNDELLKLNKDLGKLKPEITIIENQLTDLGRSAQQAFTAFATGAQSAREALKNLLDQLASQASNKLFELLFGGFKIFSTPVETTVSASSIPSAAAGRGPMAAQRVHITVDEGPMFASRVRAEAQGVSIETVQRGLRQYDSTTLPQSMRRIQREPRVIGR